VRPATVSVPFRSFPGLVATRIVTLPLPVPLAPAVIVIHESLLLAVHAHPLDVDTLIVSVPPDLSIFVVLGEIEYEHDGGGGGGAGGAGGGVAAAAWFTVNARVAIVSVPVRAAPELAATVKPTDPVPVPVAPEVTEIHDAPLVAVHRHALVVVTATGVPAPPAAATF